ncbi:hypothetical protein HanRHA438_Chr17g0832741 [Helianthus annuus]|nr:hypothetical protein HanRHA438_Chr17g0832741 [Helianthus annuus]
MVVLGLGGGGWWCRWRWVAMGRWPAVFIEDKGVCGPHTFIIYLFFYFIKER